MSAHHHILHVASMLDPYGSSRQLRLLIGELSAAHWDNEVIALRTRGKTHQAISWAGTPVFQLHERWSADPIAAGRLASMLRRRNIGLLHCWGLAALAYTCTVWPGRQAVPMLVTLTDHLPKGRLRQTLLKRLLNRVRRVVVSNLITHQQCVSMGIEPENIVILPSGVALTDPPTRSRKELLADLQLPRATRLLAVVGPLLTHKRVDDAIWCFELVRVLYDNACLLVIGDGPQRRRLERFARLVCDPGSVRFLGLVPVSR